MSFDDDEDDFSPDHDHGRSPYPLNIKLDRAVVAEALTHLRTISPTNRKRWHRQIEAVLHRLARSLQFHRVPVNVGLGRIRMLWFSRKRVMRGYPLSDASYLMTKEFLEFSRLQALLAEISTDPALAHLIVASLVIRRDWRLRDFQSVRQSKSIFEIYRPALIRIAHRLLRETERLRRKSPAATDALREKSRKQTRTIIDTVQALRAAKTPHRHLTKLTLRALKETAPFNERSDAAIQRQIQRVIKDQIPTDSDPSSSDV